MTGPETTLPRADRPRETSGFFSHASTRLTGLSPAFWILLLYLFLTTTAADEEWAQVGRFHPRLVLGLLALLVAGIRIVQGALASRRGPTPPGAVATWWSVYAGVTLLASIWAFDFGLAKDVLLHERMNALLIFPLLLALVRNRREFLLVVLVLCLGFGLYLLRSFQEYFAGRCVVTMGVKRMVGAGTSAADPNSFGATIAFSLPIVLWAGIHTRNGLLRLCVATYGVLAFVAVVLTRSRAGLILGVLTAIWLLVALPTRRARLLGLVLLVLAGALATTRLSENAIHRYVGLVTGKQTQSERESTQGRIRGYVVAARMLADRPLLGVGPGNWSNYRVKKIDGDPLMPHSLGGQVLATTGLLGTASFLAFLLSSLLFAHRERRQRRAGTPWDAAVRSFVGAMVFLLVLLLVSGLAAHNLGRVWWCAAPALMLVAARARAEATPTPEAT